MDFSLFPRKQFALPLIAALAVMLPFSPVYGDDDDFDDIMDVPAIVITADEISDPYENINRKVFSFNQTVDDIFLEPVAKFYDSIMPEWGQERVGSVLSTLSQPVALANSALQGDVTGVLDSFWRFVINATLGIGGLYDVASQAGIPKANKDFGQTLATYGVEEGSYIMLPLLGPTTTRDAFGRVVDIAIDPVTYTGPWVRGTRSGADAIHTRTELIEVIDEINENALDPYAAIRSAYIQKRKEEIRQAAPR